MTDRPPSPPRRHCIVTGCPNQPRYPGLDWSSFCEIHDDPENAETKAFQKRAVEAVRPETDIDEPGIDPELRTWLNRHEHHALFYGREHGGVDVIRCASCEDETAFYMARATPLADPDA